MFRSMNVVLIVYSRLEANGEDRKVRSSDSTRRPLGGAVVDMSRGSRSSVVPFGGGRTFGVRSATTGSLAVRSIREDPVELNSMLGWLIDQKNIVIGGMLRQY
jgi:hypothetical protein